MVTCADYDTSVAHKLKYSVAGWQHVSVMEGSLCIKTKSGCFCRQMKGVSSMLIFSKTNCTIL